MSLLDTFLLRKKTTANIAKERLKIIVAERRRQENEPPYMKQLKEDILRVICKYIKITPDMLNIDFEQTKDDLSILELNVTWPENEPYDDKE